MALSQAFPTLSSPSYDSYCEFRADIQSKLLWSQMEWEAANLVGTDRYFFCRNISHWFRKLVEVNNPNFLVLTTFSTGLQKRPSFMDILRAYKSQFGLKGLSGSSQSSNKNYIILLFDSLELKQHVMQKFCFVQQSFVVHSEWISQNQSIRFQLNWLPPDIPLKAIRCELEKHVPVSSLLRASLDLGDGDTLPSGKILGSLHSNSLPLLDSLPHFIPVQLYVAHWIIYQRSPICFTCKLTGHLSYNCPTPFCSVCRLLLPRAHVCHKHRVKSSNSPLRVSAAPLDLSSDLSKPPPVSVASPVAGFALSGLSKVQFQPHASWSSKTPISLPQAFCDQPVAQHDVYDLSLSEDDGLSGSPRDFGLFHSAMDSLHTLQSSSNKTLGELKSAFLKVTSESVLPTSKSSPALSTSLLSEGATFTYIDPVTNLPKIASKKHSKKKK